jgi:hypothetical protein
MIVTNNNNQPRLLPIAAFAGCEIAVSRVPLRRDDPSSPWCYAATLMPTIPIGDDDDDGDSDCPPPTRSTSSSKTPPPPPTLPPPGANFLATQVWPSSRTASGVVERRMDPSWTVCELGCGPGLPSLTAARGGARRVIATDVDAVALGMVRAAAMEQGFAVEDRDGGDNGAAAGGGGEDAPDDEEQRRGGRFVTMRFDLTSRDRPLPRADLYIFSDVFESSSVAEGAAWHVQNVLSDNRRINLRGEVNGEEDGENDISRVWVFAQSDRAQRDFFLRKMREWYDEHDGGDDERRQLVGWTMDHAPNREDELWLFDLDETTVDYN